MTRPFAWLMRTDLLTRLLVLVAVATAPAVLVLIYLQSELHQAQQSHVAEDALRLAELLNSDLGSIVDGARQMATAVTHIGSVRRLAPACAAPLTKLHSALTSYVTIAILAEDGRVICSAGLDPLTMLQAIPAAEVAAALQGERFETGLFTLPEGTHDAMLPFLMPFTSADGQTHGVVMAGLSLAWLAGHVADFTRPMGSTVRITDRRGTILLNLPDNELFLGKPMPPGAMALVGASRRGHAMVRGTDGQDRLVGYVPVTEEPVGLFASVALSLPDITAEIDLAAWRGYALIGIGALLSLWLAMLVGERFVRRPTDLLLQAARRWSDGDLTARVEQELGPRSEFGRLARAFNAMAEALGRQRTQLEELNATLESRVVERTGALRASRDQLQVTMAEHAKSEASLRQAQKLQVVGQLAGGIAHDFNNLLTGIIGAMDGLRGRVAQGIPPDDARSRRLVDTALMAADRGARLTAQMLSFSRRQRLLPVPTNLNTVVRGMLELMASTLGRDIRIETALDDGAWLARADPHQVESAILNLAVNARDAMAGRGTLRIASGRAIRSAGLSLVQADRAPGHSALQLDHPGSVSSDRAPAGDYVVIQVSDTGSGMAPDILGQVFEPFFTTKPPGQGSGLGLSQVHGLAAQSGGEVQIDSSPRRGTTVTLLLPRAPDDSPAGHAHRTLTVLAVDDDADVRRMTGEMLVELGHRPLLAPDGQTALAMLDDTADIDLLLTDFAMPGLIGTELITQAQQRHPNLRVILVTGLVDLDADGIHHTLLRKPFTLAALAGVIEGKQGQGAALDRPAARPVATLLPNA